MAKTNKITILAADDDCISASQTPGAAGNLLLNGAQTTLYPASGEKEWLADCPRLILVSCAGSDAARSFVVTGETQDGVRTTETIAGSSGSTTAGTKLWKRIISIVVDAATAGAVKVGTTDAVNTPWFAPNRHIAPFDVRVNANCNTVTITGYTLQHTLDDIFNSAITPDTFNDGSMASKTGTFQTVISSVVNGFRLACTGFSAGSIELEFTQAGIAGN